MLVLVPSLNSFQPRAQILTQLSDYWHMTYHQWELLLIYLSKVLTLVFSKFLEMKQNIMYSYSSFLAFYLLLRVESENDKLSQSIENHPVVYKLAQIKTILEGLAPVDENVQKYLRSLKAVKKI